MRAVVQKVKQAKVFLQEKKVSQIEAGLLLFLAIARSDSQKEVDWLVKKIVNLRVFLDKEGKMNLSLKDVQGQLLVVSQFTLYGDCSRGNRPSFVKAAEPEKAKKLYHSFIEKAKDFNLTVKSGVFGGMMEVELVNDGPVTVIINKEKKKIDN